VWPRSGVLRDRDESGLHTIQDVRQLAPDEARRRFAAFAGACRGASPLYATVATGVAENDAVTSLLAAAPPRERRASLLFAAVHYLLLAGADHPLARYYPSVSDIPASGDPSALFVDFCRSRADDLRALVATRRAQPNEVGRSAVLLPALALAAQRFAAPLTLLDLGAGAGLNLLFDRFAYSYPPFGSVGIKNSPVRLACRVEGVRPPLPDCVPAVRDRVGVDERVLDVTKSDDALWVRACVWPDRRIAAANVEGAIKLAQATPPHLVAGHVLDVLPRALADAGADGPVAVVTAATLAYLNADERRELSDALRRLSADRELVWITFEGAGSSPVADRVLATAGRRTLNGGYLALRDFTHRSMQLLGCAGMHGDWLEWRHEDLRQTPRSPAEQ
jgi:hypothetical protein